MHLIILSTQITYKTSSPQASQKGVLVSSTGFAEGGLVGVLFHSGWPGEEVGDTAAGDADDGSFCEGLRTGWDGATGWLIWTIPGRATGWGCPGRAITGAGGATGMLWAGFITGGLGLYILGSAVLDGLGRSPFGLSKTLPGASDEVKIYRPFVKVLAETPHSTGHRSWIKDTCRCCLIKNRANKAQPPASTASWSILNVRDCTCFSLSSSGSLKASGGGGGRSGKQ